MCNTKDAFGVANATPDVFVLRDRQSFFTLLPVARAEFVGLQCIKNTQNFFRAASHREIGDIDEADDAFGIDQESCALGDAFFRIENAQLLGEFALDVSEHGEGQILQVSVWLLRHA